MHLSQKTRASDRGERSLGGSCGTQKYSRRGLCWAQGFQVRNPAYKLQDGTFCSSALMTHFHSDLERRMEIRILSALRDVNTGRSGPQPRHGVTALLFQ